MTAKIIEGNKVAAEIREELKGRVARLKEKGVTPGLGVVLVGEDPASISYVTSKAKGSAEIGMFEETIRLPANAEEALVLLPPPTAPRLSCLPIWMPCIATSPAPSARCRPSWSGCSPTAGLR